MKSIITVLKAMADPNRLTILYLLRQQALCVCDLQRLIPLTQGALSTQLKNLSVAGLLSSNKQGKWVFYQLDKTMPKVYKTVLMQLFRELDDDENIIKLTKKLAKLQEGRNC